MEGSLGGAALAVGFFLAFQGCGVCLSRRLLPQESPAARLLLGSVWGSLLLAWLPALWAFPLGFSPAAQGLALLTALGLGGLCLGKAPRPRPRAALAPFARQPLLWGVLGVWLFFCYLVWHGFRWEGGAVYSSQATYGDMSMHLSFLTSLARQGDFPPDYSLLPGEPLCYPFLSDSVSSSLYQLGAPLWLAYQLPMWAAGAQVFFGLWLFFSRLGEGRATALAWIFFVFNGGLGFLFFFEEGGLARIFTEYYQTPTNLVEENVRWVNVIADMLLPQRATLFGWAALFPALALLVSPRGRRYWLLAGAMAACLPMIHTHSFLAMGVLCGGRLLGWLLERLGWLSPAARVGKVLLAGAMAALAGMKVLFRGEEENSLFLWLAGAVLALVVAAVAFLAGKVAQRRGWRALAPWGLLFLAAVLPALPQLFFWTFRQSGGFLRGHLGWATGQEGYLSFYLKNLGLVGVLAPIALFSAGGKAFWRAAPGLLLWLLAELVLFQPNEYDNNKLLYPAYAFLCGAAARWLADALGRRKRRGLRAGLLAGAVALSSCSAALTLGREAVASYQLFSPGAVDFARWVEENTPADALFLTDTRHNNEVAALAGRSVVCGSPVYLYYHGLPYAKNEHYAQVIYQQPRQSGALLEELGVDYILVSDFERASYAVDEAALESLYPAVYQQDGWTLYQRKENEG